ncbi:hypothetical protein PQX77_012295 [Marasmius sp. AFHP31]|nr:hypothetical protein PQX77_012295 [Marasmius sp. AFHP31]
MEVSLLQEMLEDDQETLQKNNAAITVLEEKLDMLRRGRSILEGNISLYRSALSVCWRVPMEIWQLIFTFLCWNRERSSLKVNRHRLFSGSNRTVYESPMITLTHVCRSWRAIARGLPILWSSISIEVDFLNQDFRGPLRLHLENSKDNPLHLRVRRKADRFMTRQPTKHGIELWALLGPHIHRCRVLALEGNGYEALPKYPDASLPQLRELSLGDTSRHIDEQSWLWQAMRNAPRLTVADLSRAHE